VPVAPEAHPLTDGVRGMAIKFRLSDGSEADMVCTSANGFPVATGEDFLALPQAAGASGPDVPKPTPVEKFLSTHPAALAFCHAAAACGGYGTQPLFGVNAFKFTNTQGMSKFGRYRIVPESGPAFVSDEEAAKRPPNGLADNLKFRLLVQVAAADNSTTDGPDSRPTVELGEIAVIKALESRSPRIRPAGKDHGRSANSCDYCVRLPGILRPPCAAVLTEKAAMKLQ
jgi:catalase